MILKMYGLITNLIIIVVILNQNLFVKFNLYRTGLPILVPLCLYLDSDA